jgi:hypothetical protein
MTDRPVRVDVLVAEGRTDDRGDVAQSGIARDVEPSEQRTRIAAEEQRRAFDLHDFTTIGTASARLSAAR